MCFFHTFCLNLCFFPVKLLLFGSIFIHIHIYIHTHACIFRRGEQTKDSVHSGIPLHSLFLLFCPVPGPSNTSQVYFSPNYAPDCVCVWYLTPPYCPGQSYKLQRPVTANTHHSLTQHRGQLYQWQKLLEKQALEDVVSILNILKYRIWEVGGMQTSVGNRALLMKSLDTCAWKHADRCVFLLHWSDWAQVSATLETVQVS